MINLSQYSFFTGVRRILVVFSLVILFFGCESDNFDSVIDRESVVRSLPVPGNSGLISVSQVSANSISIDWNIADDDNTSPQDLQYTVVISSYDNISSVDSALLNGIDVSGWTSGISGYDITGLAEGELYHINVLVRDGEGYMAAYRNILVSTIVTDSYPVPGNGGGLYFTGITTTGFTLNWVKAVDAETPQGSLLYQVYISSGKDISTYSDAIINGSQVTAGWIADINSINISGLLPGAFSFLNVFVSDGDGNISSYVTLSVSTDPLLQPPAAGNSGLLAISGIATDGFSVAWTKASDLETAQANLQYQVYISHLNNISTYTEAVANGWQYTYGWTVDINTILFTGLSAGTSYYVNVFVQDSDGMIAPYVTASALTAAETIYLFAAGNNKGDLGGRIGADSICRSAKTSSYPALPVTKIRAFITISSADQIITMPVYFGVPGNTEIRSPGGTLIANNWADLTDGSIATDLLAAGVGSPLTSWWSGSNAFGQWFSDAFTCSGFSDGTNAFNGEIGAHNVVDSTWIEYSTASCNSNQTLLCIGW